MNCDIVSDKQNKFEFVKCSVLAKWVLIDTNVKDEKKDVRLIHCT